jgi:hypothetical protein
VSDEIWYDVHISFSPGDVVTFWAASTQEVAQGLAKLEKAYRTVLVTSVPKTEVEAVPTLPICSCGEGWVIPQDEP